MRIGVIVSMCLACALPKAARASGCGNLDASGEWLGNAGEEEQRLTIRQLGCDSATMTDARHGISYFFLFDGKTHSVLPRAWISFLRRHLPEMDRNDVSIESGSYVSSIQNDPDGTFVKIEGTVEITYHRPFGGKPFTIDVGGDATISAREIHHFQPECNKDTKEIQLSFWVGHLRILRVKGATKTEARDAAFALAHRQNLNWFLPGFLCIAVKGKAPACRSGTGSRRGSWRSCGSPARWT